MIKTIDNWNLCPGVNIHTHTKGSVGLTLVKDSVIRVSIPLDLSTRFFIPPPYFLRCLWCSCFSFIMIKGLLTVICVVSVSNLVSLFILLHLPPFSCD